jgi:hypothetical protein
MSPRPRSMLLTGTAAATLCLAGAALGQGGTGPDAMGAPYDRAAIALPANEHVVPTASQDGTLAAKDDPAPGEQQTPPPPPSGCPFRDGKLELIV